jgi:hypothetical protein
MNDLTRKRVVEKIVIVLVAILLPCFIYFLYFLNHFCFHTIINGVNVSLKSQEDAKRTIRSFIHGYALRLIERNGNTEVLEGRDIGMQYNADIDLSNIIHIQKMFKPCKAILNRKIYFEEKLYSFDKHLFIKKVNQLSCFHKRVTKPCNVRFQFIRDSYVMMEAIEGNQLKKSQVYEVIRNSLQKGETELDFNEKSCYEKPRYTTTSEKTLFTKHLLDQFVSTKILYEFGNKKEIIDGNVIHEWIIVDNDLEVSMNTAAVKQFVTTLANRYNTVGTTRNFKTSTGKIIRVSGGLYGWKIDVNRETKEILKNMNTGDVVKREPVYSQRALLCGADDIGDTYVEINITKQHLWFYKNGALITDGAVVTGNPNRGNATALGTYMINYKEKGSVLSGRNYDVKVAYWMPFYGNIGIHDAHWRYSFGGEIYKTNGTHGCVNTPGYMAKAIFENIEKGIPVICYEE